MAVLRRKIPADAATLEPPAIFNPALAYVVVTALSVTGKLSGNFTIGSGVLGLDGGGKLDVGCCTAFPSATGSLTKRSPPALTQFKTIFNPTEIAALSSPTHRHAGKSLADSFLRPAG